MQQLSEKGADMEIENIHGETPYGECASNNVAHCYQCFYDPENVSVNRQ